MSGTIRGRIESLITEANQRLQAGVVFKNIYDVLDGHPGTTLISLGYGAGSGTDYPDGGSPFGDNAHFVFRFDTHAGRTYPWFLFVTVGGISSITGISGQINGGVGSASAGQVAASCAVGFGGDENPWNGTENADGTDTVPATLWANPGGGGTQVQVCPASNSTSGPDGTNKDNGIALYNEPGSSNVRYNIVCDDDVFVCVWDEATSGSYEMSILGAFDPNPGLTAYPKPIIASYSSLPISLTGVQTDDISGVSNPDVAVVTWEAAASFFHAPGGGTSLFSANQFPDPNGGAVYSEFPLGIATSRTSHGGFRGLLPFIGVTYNVPTLDTDAAEERAVFGSSSTPTVKCVVPWDGATTPGTGVDRAGTDFTRVP